MASSSNVAIPTAGAQAAEPGGGVLAEYVARPDAEFSWKVRQTFRVSQSDFYELTLTSQAWRGMTWRHRLMVVMPDSLGDTADAMLMVTGGKWSDEHAQPTTDQGHEYQSEITLLAGFAEQLGSPIAVLLNVPRQPIFDGRVEDAIIAYTFDKYLLSGESDWPLLLPMVKSVTRAMDALQAFAAEKHQIKLNHFTVTGGSKRGWTTWLTAAVDPRVAALSPMVIDMLNMQKQLGHQVAAWGDYSHKIHDYTDLDLPRRFDSAEGEKLREIVDPFAYRDRITQPKLLMLGTNDPYWPLDALNHYWDGLVGTKYVLYVPNAGHGLDKDISRIYGGTRALHLHATGERSMPPIQWNHQPHNDGSRLSLQPGAQVTQVRLWTATSERRDFREAKWTAAPLTPDEQGRYVIDVPAEPRQYKAYFAEAVYPHGGMPLFLSTTLRLLHPTATRP